MEVRQATGVFHLMLLLAIQRLLQPQPERLSPHLVVLDQSMEMLPVAQEGSVELPRMAVLMVVQVVQAGLVSVLVRLEKPEQRIISIHLFLNTAAEGEVVPVLMELQPRQLLVSVVEDLVDLHHLQQSINPERMA
jgi:hypothetical protein